MTDWRDLADADRRAAEQVRAVRVPATTERMRILADGWADTLEQMASLEELVGAVVAGSDAVRAGVEEIIETIKAHLDEPESARRIVTAAAVQDMRRALEQAGRPSGYDTLARKLQVSQSTIRRRLGKL